MSAGNSLRTLALMTALTLVSLAGISQVAKAQSATPTPTPDAGSKQRPRTATNKPPVKPTSDGLEPDDAAHTPADVPQDSQANRHEQQSEENDVVSSYNNFFNTYKLGPEDVISVSVFNQDRYSRSGIAIPPSGRISLALIPGGVFVNGKTVEEVADIIKKRYDEYIIDPQVTVSLDKANSYRYSVIGDVGQPGIKLMSRRLTVTEAIAESGGVLSTGSKSKIFVLRRQANGTLAQIPVNVDAIYKGKAPDTTYLIPGDQVFVPGNTLKKFQTVMGMVQVLSFARTFAGL